MPRHDLSYDAIAPLLYRLILEQASDYDNSEIDKWASTSIYNRSLLEDLRSDSRLRKLLMEAFYQHPEKFWDVVVVYRAALHV